MIKEYFFPLKDRKEIAENTMAFWFDTSGTDFSFQAGQFVNITLLNPPYPDEKTNTRSLSIASSPNHKDYFMTVMRMRHSGYKNSLKEIPLGTKVKVLGPFGHFILHKNKDIPAVFLVGGIGATPARSIIEWVLEKKVNQKIFIFYSNQNLENFAFLNEFIRWGESSPNVKVIPTITSDIPSSWKYETGRINQEMLKKYLPDLKAPVYYIAGPKEMVLSMKEMLSTLGVIDSNIVIESFSGYS